MNQMLNHLRQYGPPAALGYAGVKLAQAVTAGSSKPVQVLVGVGVCGVGVYIGMQVAAGIPAA